MSVLAVIPARGGSVGVPGKNLRPLAGRPLLAWSVACARAASSVDRVLVSTEDQAIAQAARDAGAETPFVRPAHLADGAVHSVHVVLHALDWLEAAEGALPELILMLLPTSPFRRPEHIDGAVEVMRRHKPVSVISVCPLHHPLITLRWIRRGELVPVHPQENMNQQRQEAEPVYTVNGSIYVSTPQALRTHGTFHAPGAAPYVMGELESLDINTLDDFRLAGILAPHLEKGEPR